MTTATETIPAAPVLVRTGVPGKPFTWVDPTPHTADENGHVWIADLNEPSPYPLCLLCLDEQTSRAAVEPCEDAESLPQVNEHRARWIAEHRVEGGAL